MLPSGALGKSAVWIVSVTIPRRVSMTETQSLEAQATKIRSSLGWTAIWLGCSPTAIRATVRRSAGIEDADRAAGPVGDKELVAVAGEATS